MSKIPGQHGELRRAQHPRVRSSATAFSVGASSTVLAHRTQVPPTTSVTSPPGAVRSCTDAPTREAETEHAGQVSLTPAPRT
jgi:hypothetical protein